MRAPWLVVLAASLAPLGGCFLFRGGDPARCPMDRTIVLASQSDVARFAGCKQASGVAIRTGATIDTEPLRELEDITGDLVIGPTVGVEQIQLNDLQRVGGAIRVASNGSLRSLFLPRLEAAGRIDVESNVSLTAISMPRLTTVAGAVVIVNNLDLELVAASALVSARELVIGNQPKLTLVQLDHLAVAESIRIDDNPKLPADLVEGLRARTTPP
jgi:hypothetical protein